MTTLTEARIREIIREEVEAAVAQALGRSRACGPFIVLGDGTVFIGGHLACEPDARRK